MVNSATKYNKETFISDILNLLIDIGKKVFRINLTMLINEEKKI